MVNNYKIEVSYDGTNFFGFQRQNDLRTIQGELEKAITQLNSENQINLNASGRTDSRVHALKQVCTFETKKNLDLNYFVYGVNKILPYDIRVNNVEKVDTNFHPRHCAVLKHYQYKINIGEYNVFENNYIYQLNKRLNINKMLDAAKLFVGKQDYRTFTSARDYQNTTKEIFSITITLKNDIIVIDYCGNGFLRYMVRKITMFLIDIGMSKCNIADISKLLEQKDINAYSKIAPGQGLYLVNVSYNINKGDMYEKIK